MALWLSIRLLLKEEMSLAALWLVAPGGAACGYPIPYRADGSEYYRCRPVPVSPVVPGSDLSAD